MIAVDDEIGPYGSEILGRRLSGPPEAVAISSCASEWDFCTSMASPQKCSPKSGWTWHEERWGLTMSCLMLDIVTAKKGCLDIQEVHCPCVSTTLPGTLATNMSRNYGITYRHGEEYQKMSFCRYEQKCALMLSSFDTFDAKWHIGLRCQPLSARIDTI